MAEAPQSESPLEAAAGAAGARTMEAFELLSNETRLAILFALWDNYEPFQSGNAITFSELRAQVGVRDSGQFNYHLDKLTGHYVRKLEAGYELRRAGHQLVRTVIAGVGFEEPSIERHDLDWDCPICDAPTAVVHQDEWIYQVCTECEGKFGGSHENVPEGTLTGAALYPASVVDRNPAAVLNATWVKGEGNRLTNVEGVCDACAGPMESWLHRCMDHVPEGVCPTCGRRSPVAARFRCSVCKRYHAISLPILVRLHPAVIAFYYDRGVPILYERPESDDFQPRHSEIDYVADFEEEIVREEPPRVRLRIRYEGDELQVTLDEDLTVVDVVGPVSPEDS